MKTGTKSLLFGVHQFIWHPITVFLAWRELYGLPTWREAVCIFVHDWGYWGCAEMDGPDGVLHPWRGARIADWLFGDAHARLALYHSRSLSRKYGVEPSQLCWPDKRCCLFDPAWFYLLRARLSGEIKEYRRNADSSGFVPAQCSDRIWYQTLCAHSRRVSDENA